MTFDTFDMIFGVVLLSRCGTVVENKKVRRSLTSLGAEQFELQFDGHRGHPEHVVVFEAGVVERGQQQHHVQHHGERINSHEQNIAQQQQQILNQQAAVEQRRAVLGQGRARHQNTGGYLLSKKSSPIIWIQKKLFAICERIAYQQKALTQNTRCRKDNARRLAGFLQFYKQLSSYTWLLGPSQSIMEGYSSRRRREDFRENPDRLGKSGGNDSSCGRNWRSARQYESRNKRKVPKVQLILEQAKQQLAQPFPAPDFLMLTCFAEMTELQKASLTQEWKGHLAAHMADLPRLRQEIEAKSQQRQEQSASGSYQQESRWMEATARDIQRQIVVISNSFELQCRQLRPMQLKILQTRDFIQY